MLPYFLLSSVLPPADDFRSFVALGVAPGEFPCGSDSAIVGPGSLLHSSLHRDISGGGAHSDVSRVLVPFRDNRSACLDASSAIPHDWSFPYFPLVPGCKLEGPQVVSSDSKLYVRPPIISSSPSSLSGCAVDSIDGALFQMRREVFPLYRVLPAPPVREGHVPSVKTLRRGELRLSKYFPCFPSLRNSLMPAGVRCGGVVVEMCGPMGRVSSASTALFLATRDSLCAGFISHASTNSSVLFNVFLDDDRLGVFLSLMRGGEDSLSSGVQLVTFDVERPKLSVAVCSVSASPDPSDSYSLLGVRNVCSQSRGGVSLSTRHSSSAIAGRDVPVPLNGEGLMDVRSKWTPVNTSLITLYGGVDSFVLDCRVALRISVSSSWSGPRLVLSVTLVPRVCGDV